MKLKNLILVLLFMTALPAMAYAIDIDINSSNYEPAPATPGNLFTLWVHVKNTTPYEAEDVVFELKYEYPFSLPAGESATEEIGTIRPNQIVLVQKNILVEGGAPDGTYEIEMKVGDNSTVSRTVKKSIVVQNVAPVLEVVGSSVTEAMPGENVAVTLELKNVGTSSAHDIVVKIAEDRTVTTTGVVVERDIVPLGASSAYINEIRTGGTGEAELMLGVNNDADLKNYTLPIAITYYDSQGTQRSSSSYIGIKVSADPEIDLVISEISPVAYIGGKSVISFDIFNVGAASARYVVVEVSANGIAVSDPKQFIGTLEADDFDSFKSTFDFSGTEAGEKTITVKLTYKDQENQPSTFEKTLYLTVAGGQGSAEQMEAIASIITTIIILVILAGVGYIIYIKFFRKKRA